ncbi:hypothetical protein RGUI_2131 [Rhodovulum sp. P5]|uniref:DUF302 domain-containing protein n=1 Tax=Rhodovulum sp. P5 TaxID=1564506 RepID=UPI0009C302C2|nr:DUF302 domain-containing protein [Rhodovulum sp. P5]ARE40272.1 hypothetical protein RGUI_2131 [Rhodovulum sp. P5]
MSFIKTLLAIVGAVSVIALVAVAVMFGPSMRSLDGKAGAIYWDMAQTLLETGDIAEATIWKRKVADGLTFDDVELSIESVANDMNIKAVGTLPLGDEVAAMRGEPWRVLKIYLYCNPLTAAKMIEYSEAFAAYLPCRVTLVEDGEGALWLYTLNMDMMVHGGRPLPDDLREEAQRVRDIILAILDKASTGDF